MTTVSKSPTTIENTFNEFAAVMRPRIDRELSRLLPPETEAPANVHSAMRWSVFAGGKRFRPLLVLVAAETFGADRESLLSTACAFEFIHTYSLIHDDLPSMDNDELRRGQPTCHVRYGEGIAILAGDALQTLAFKTISESEQLSFETRVHLIRELSQAAGTPLGMVAGQAEDLAAESQTVNSKELEKIHRLKTGALIIAATRCGAIIAGADERELAAVTEYANSLGLLFQITDDLLDVTATAETLGKTPGKDARSEKATYPALYGVDLARERALHVHSEACSALEKIKRPTDCLHSIADFILQRSA